MALSNHSLETLHAWEALQALCKSQDIVIDGNSLSIPGVIAVSRHAILIYIDGTVEEKVTRSVEKFEEYIAKGNTIYGVNIGFGGSASSVTNDSSALQQSLLQMQTYGVLTKSDTAQPTTLPGSGSSMIEPDFQSMPRSWVKGSMLIRCNSLIRGHSGLRLETVGQVLTLIEHDITPIVPLRGSISASGDLSPLSYIASALQGNPDTFVRVEKDTGQHIIPSDKALKEIGVSPVVFGHKESLGLINGTSFSAAVGALAVWEANHIAALSQAMTAMATETLSGHTANYHPFISEVRPHPGQKEAAENILSFLAGSRLAKSTSVDSANSHDIDVPDSTSAISSSKLVQDRYALRTAPQWIGPQLEDLMLANRQLTVELNSTTDNPLVDASSSQTQCFNSGNFQSTSITSAVEKTRGALQMLGKMIFAQCGELINPGTNNGLPANLAADDPSLSFTAKGIDIAMAAYMSELAYLANPVSSHVQSAEMHNQAINSLALISARKTMEAVDVISMMCASYLFVLCQALDLRVLQEEFFRSARSSLQDVTTESFGDICYNVDTVTKIHDLCAELWACVLQSWTTSGTCDLDERCDKAVVAAAPVLLQGLIGGRFNVEENARPADHLRILHWQVTTKTVLAENYDRVRTTLFEEHTRLTPKYLGRASTKLYAFVREELGVPMHRGLVDFPRFGETDEGPTKVTIGSSISRIYEALRDGRILRPVMECLKEKEMKSGQ